jgi:hypothetical protein
MNMGELKGVQLNPKIVYTVFRSVRLYILCYEEEINLITPPQNLHNQF